MKRTLPILLLSPAAALAATAKSVPSAGGSLLATFLSLALVIAVILVMAWLFRRLQGRVGGALGGLRVVGGVSLGTRERAVLVQAGDKQLLIGVAPGRVNTLHVFDEPVEGVGQPSVAGESFAERLRKTLQHARGGKS